MQLTENHIKGLLGSNRNAAEWLSLANELLPKYNINTNNRIAAFFAQAGHESLDFTILEENLNYSWQRLRAVFPRYYKTDAQAITHHRKPELIANRVYSDKLRTNKLGNVNEGDGWRFRGRGLFQLTGRWNYEAFGKSVGMTAEQAAEYCETKRGALESALWYWQRNNLNRFADADDVTGLSRAVNGGTIGLADRQARYSTAKRTLVIKQNLT